MKPKARDAFAEFLARQPSCLHTGQLFRDTFLLLQRRWISLLVLSTIICMAGIASMLPVWQTYYYSHSIRITYYNDLLLIVSLENAFTALVLFMSGIAVATQDRRGEPLQVFSALGLTLRRLPLTLAVIILAWCTLAVGFLLLLVPGLILMAGFYVILPVCIAERRGVIGTLKRSLELTKNQRWPIFGLALLLLVIQHFDLIMIDIIRLLDYEDSLNIAVASLVWETIATIFCAVFISIIYKRLKLRLEGVELPTIASVFD